MSRSPSLCSRGKRACSLPSVGSRGAATLRKLVWLDAESDTEWFPALEHTLDDPPGLLAAGGTLNPQRILAAYERGIFPWYSQQQPILWWAPDPRMVLFPREFSVSRSLKKTLQSKIFTTRLDTAFGATIKACAAPRRSGPDTWLNLNMIKAYEALHQLGFGHSVETYCADQLVGGLYGLQLGQVFFGESMFSLQTDASKVALARLVDECKMRHIELIDCQVASDHLASLGAREVSRNDFIGYLKRYARRTASGNWVNMSS